MIITFECDTCHKEFDGSPHSYPGDGDSCERCALESELRGAKLRRDDKKKWLEETHLNDLRTMEAKVAELKGRLANLLSPASRVVTIDGHPIVMSHKPADAVE